MPSLYMYDPCSLVLIVVILCFGKSFAFYRSEIWDLKAF